MTHHNVSRRKLLGLGAAAVAAELGAMLLPGCGGGLALNSSPGPSSCSKLTDIEHVVILIQENRSFDHYFGSYRAVRGFSDPSPAFSSPIRRTPLTHRLDYCCHSISTLPRRMQPALMTSLTPGWHSIRAGTMVPWMALCRRVFRSIPMTRH